MNQDTICAISTAPGAGGIAVIRVSGPEAIVICNRLFTPKVADKTLLTQKAYTLRYGSIKRGDELIDDVLVALFKGPHSFTGEDTIEITCHGSVYIQQQILQLLIENGCRQAGPAPEGRPRGAEHEGAEHGQRVLLSFIPTDILEVIL